MTRSAWNLDTATDADRRVCYFGRFEGPDHLYPTCPALARVRPWRQPWPATTVDLVDPTGTDLCGWCTRVWRARYEAEHSPLRSVAGEHGTGWMLDATRARLRESGLPYVIENVEAARMPGSLVLCGTEFGLEYEGRWLRRHRRFESSVFLLGAGGCQCNRPDSPTGVYGDLARNDRRVRHSKRGDVMMRAGVETARVLLGCPWMDAAELSQAIPPAYTTWVGEQLLAHLALERAA